MSWSDPRALRENNLDFIRFALAALVIFAHSFALLAGSDDVEPLMRLTGGQLTFGALAVDGFFILSGFLVTQSWLRGDGALSFFRKRVLRIYPGFVAAVLVGTLVVVPIASSSLAVGFASIDPLQLLWGCVSLRGYYWHPGSFQGNPVPGVVNGSLWSVSYEFWCYVGVALLGTFQVLRRPRLLLGLFVLALVGGVAYLVAELALKGKFLAAVFGEADLWARLLPCYLAGCVFCVFRERLPYSAGLSALAAISLIAAAFVPHAVNALTPLAGAWLLFWVGFHPWLPLQHWGRYGDFSYGLYLYAFPVQQLLIRQLGTKIGPLPLFVLSLLATMACAYASWHLVELPFLRLKRAARSPLKPAGP